MTFSKYQHKILEIVVQDVAEIWFPGEDARHLGTLGDMRHKCMKDEILKVTGEELNERTIRNFINEFVLGNKATGSNLPDLFAACWLVLMRLRSHEEVNLYEGGNIRHRFDECVGVFRSRKNNEFSKVAAQKEGRTLEHKRNLISATELATHICGFANTVGGYILFGVHEGSQDEKPEITGFASTANLLTLTDAALRRLFPRPKADCGWTYVNDQDKTVFAIKVARSSLMGRVKDLEGGIYIRVGDETKLLDNEMRSGPNGVRHEKVTAARSNALKRFRGFRAIVDDIEEYRERFKQESTSPDEELTLPLLARSFIADTVVVYLAEILDAINARLPSEFAPLVGYAFSVNIAALRGGDVRAFVDLMRATPEIQEILENGIETLVGVFNAGSHEYKQKDIEAPAVPLFPDMLCQVDGIIEKIDAVAHDKYELDRIVVRIPY